MDTETKLQAIYSALMTEEAKENRCHINVGNANEWDFWVKWECMIGDCLEYIKWRYADTKKYEELLLYWGSYKDSIDYYWDAIDYMYSLLPKETDE